MLPWAVIKICFFLCQLCSRIDLPINNEKKKKKHLFSINLGYEEIVNRLLNNWANVNKENAIGQTPLHLAAISDNTKIAKLLLDLGSDPNHADHDGNTPVHSVISIHLFNFIIYNKKKQQQHVHTISGAHRFKIWSIL